MAMTTANEIIFTVALSNGEDFDVSYDNVGTVDVAALKTRCLSNSAWDSTAAGYTGLTDSTGAAHGVGIKACRVVTTETEVLS